MIKIVVAADLHNGIGLNGKLPWHLKADMARFKSLTMGGTVVMGRKTFEGIGKPLKGRRCIVLSTDEKFSPEGVEVMHSVQDLVDKYLAFDEDIWIIGGASLYRYFWYVADEIYLTRVLVEVKGCDTFVPAIDEDLYTLESRDPYDADGSNDHPYEFLVYKKL